MYEYDECNNDLIVEKKRLEVELVKLALDKIFRPFLFETNPNISVKHIDWQLKQFFSFPIEVKKLADSSFEFKMQNGEDFVTLEYAIYDSKVEFAG